jgi:ubiquinone/menaquinone biosynthesis C-methylase UbiE
MLNIDQEKAVWLNPEHPNYERWRRGRKLATKRAEVVKKIISSIKTCENLTILDLGSGEGRTSSLFAGSNNVISYDISLPKLKKQQLLNQKYSLINGMGEFLPFYDYSFDIIILQDVVEHIEKRDLLINELSRVLREHGIIYLSTPNKHSIVNIISDPHWGIPFLSLFKRPVIRKYFLRLFRGKDLRRNDIAELLSLRELKNLLKDYRLHINTKEIVQLLSQDSSGILWSGFHLFLYNLLKMAGLFSVLGKITNNESGFVNNFLTPTFYIIAKR